MPKNTVYGGNPAHFIMTLADYCEKCEKKYLADAAKDAKYIYKRYARKPTFWEMKNYAPLFSARTPECYEKYGMNNAKAGIQWDTYIRCIEQSEQMFNSYEDFLDFALSDSECDHS